MSPMIRQIKQPGPAHDPRIVAVSATAHPLAVTIPPGPSLLSGLHGLLQEGGFDSGSFRLSGGAIGPFAYVMPDLSPDDDHAAFYSETFRPDGIATLREGCVTVGWRDGEPFFHCHGLWTQSDSRVRGGHILPAECQVAAPIAVTGVGITNARFEIGHDAETGFPVFSPVRAENTAGGAPSPCRALAIRLKPNQDITRALESLTRDAGWQGAVLHGGVGSLIGARYRDAPPIDAFATEMFLTEAHIDPAGHSTRIRTTLVDHTGGLSGGTLIPDDNPILMTFEGVLTERPD